MRILSLVPSWTETLLAAGVDVVGRTRYCIHPEDRVAAIPRVGGTKDWNWAAIQKLAPDLIILDREENPKFMGEQTEIPFHATHVRSVHDLPVELEQLAKILNNDRLKEMAGEWREVLARPIQKWSSRQGLPGLLEWGLKPDREDIRFLYLIWRDPWMSVGQDTFIASMFRELGLPLIELPDSYPKVDLDQFARHSTVLLFSSEPYPFLKHRQDLVKLGLPHAFVDGEMFSWFGLRSLKFLVLTKR